MARGSTIPFEIVSPIEEAKTIARGRNIRELKRIVRAYGLGNWRKRKGTATIKFKHGSIYQAEVHWYEATGIGKREFKVKRFL